MAAARLAVDVLAKAVEENALEVLDARRLDLGLHAQGRQLAHAMGQQRDAHAQLFDLWHALVHVAGDAPLMQRQGKGQSGNAPADDHNGRLRLRAHAQSAAMPLRLITAPQRG